MILNNICSHFYLPHSCRHIVITRTDIIFIMIESICAHTNFRQIVIADTTNIDTDRQRNIHYTIQYYKYLEPVLQRKG